MSDEFSLGQIVFEKFRRAFGDPDRTDGVDRQWSLRRLSYISSVNVLLDCGSDPPLLWVFDPHDPSNGVSNQRIRHESHIDEIIKLIGDRVKRAGHPKPH